MKTRFSYWVRLLSILLVMGLTLSSISLARASDTTQSFETFFDTALQEQLATEYIAGATVAVVQNGKLAFAKGYGYADVDAGIPVQVDRTLFFIGSDGKLFTWTAVMQLVEQGKLDLHTDINNYLDFKIPSAFEKPITLHHVMTHTAGFEDEYNSLFVNEPGDLIPLREHLIRYMPTRIFAPGEVMAYSNYGTALAGYIIERVSGQTFETYLTEHLLQPLGMDHSFVGNALPSELATDLSKGYKYQNGEFNASDFEWTSAIPVAPIRTTATDLSRFMLAHLNNGCVDDNCILRPETMEQMHAMQFTHHPQMGGMAYGFMNMQVNRQKILWHLGNSPRFVTMLVLIPEQNLGVMVSYNTPPADDGRAILFSFMDEFFPREPTPLNESLLPDWQERANIFNGSYAPARSNLTSSQILVRYSSTVPVKITEGRLTFNGWEFIETGPGTFHQVNGGRVLTFKEDEMGGRWLFVGVLAYFQVPWYETISFLLVVVAGYLVISLAILFTWFIRRRYPSTPSWRSSLVAGGLAIFDLGLFAWLVVKLMEFQGTYVYSQGVEDIVTKLYWLSIPWTLAVLVIAVRAWRRRAWTLGWRIYYSSFSVSATVFLWLLQNLNLLGK